MLYALYIYIYVYIYICIYIYMYIYIYVYIYFFLAAYESGYLIGMPIFMKTIVVLKLKSYW
jgi:hypothetical protein